MQRPACQLQPMRSLFLWDVYVVNAVNKFCSIGPWISTIWRSTKPRMLFSSNVWRCFSIWSPINLFVPVLIFSTMLMPVSLFKTGQRVMPGSGKIRPKKVCGEITLRPSSIKLINFDSFGSFKALCSPNKMVQRMLMMTTFKGCMRLTGTRLSSDSLRKCRQSLRTSSSRRVSRLAFPKPKSFKFFDRNFLCSLQ